jgi:hypothetical protein
MTAEDQWRDPHKALRVLYEHAESRAIEAAEWYLDDRIKRRFASQALRLLAILLAAVGGLQPLAATAIAPAVPPGPGHLAWGYIMLAVAGVCVACDHFLGLSSRWMRDMVTAQKLQHRLIEFQLDWVELEVRGATDPGAATTHDYLRLLRSFITDTSTVTHEETLEWLTEFQSTTAQLSSQINQPAPRTGKR